MYTYGKGKIIWEWVGYLDFGIYVLKMIVLVSGFPHTLTNSQVWSNFNQSAIINAFFQNQRPIHQEWVRVSKYSYYISNDVMYVKEYFTTAYD